MAGPSTRSFRANSSGIGLCCADAVVMTTVNTATTAKADFNGVIRVAPTFLRLFRLTWPIPSRICTDFPKYVPFRHLARNRNEFLPAATHGGGRITIYVSRNS